MFKTTAIEDIEMIIQNVAKDNKIIHHKTKVTCADGMGQNYIGEIFPVVLIGQKSGQPIKLNLIVKVPQNVDNIDDGGIVREMFSREMFTYTNLLPTYNDLQQSLHEDLKFTMINCYYHQTEPKKEALVLQDMRLEGYSIFTKSMFLDLDQMQLTIREIAKFHALSFALQNIQPEVFAEYTGYCKPFMEYPVLNTTFVELVENSLNKHLSYMTNVDLRERLKTCLKTWEGGAVVKKGRARVICHADLWRNNVMFKYEGNKPISACLLDFQLIQYINPATDLLHFISVCTKHELRQNNYEQLLHLYHKTMSEVLNKFSLNADAIYSFEDLKEDLKSMATFCLMKGIFSLQTWYRIGGLHCHPNFCKHNDDKITEVVLGKYLTAANEMISDYVEYGFI